MKKVIFLTTELSKTNGWGQYSYQIIKRLPAYDIKPIVLTAKNSKSIDLQDITVKPVLRSYSDGILKPFYILLDWLQIRKDLKDAEYIHCLVEPYILIASLLTFKKKLVISIQ